MGFNQTAVKTAVKGIESGGKPAPKPADQRERLLKIEAKETFPPSSPQPKAVLCGSYRKDIRSLLRAYEQLSAAGIRVFSASGHDFDAAIRGFRGRRRDEPGTTPEGVTRLLERIRDADLVWLHAPGGDVGLTGALQIGFAMASGVPVYAEELPKGLALHALVTIAPLDQVIAETIARERNDPGPSRVGIQDSDPAIGRQQGAQRISAEDIMRLITEEIGELAHQNPGQRHRLFSKRKD